MTAPALAFTLLDELDQRLARVRAVLSITTEAIRDSSANAGLSREIDALELVETALAAEDLEHLRGAVGELVPSTSSTRG